MRTPLSQAHSLAGMLPSSGSLITPSRLLHPHFELQQGGDSGDGSLLADLRRSHDHIDPADPEFSPLAANALPAYLVGDPAYDPMASYDAASGYGDGYGASGGAYRGDSSYDGAHDNAAYGTPYGGAAGSAYDGGTSYDAGSAYGDAAAYSTPTGNVSAFSIEGAAPLSIGAAGGSTAGGAGGARKTTRRGSIEEDYQSQAFAQPAGSFGGPDYAGLPTATPPPPANGGPQYLAGEIPHAAALDFTGWHVTKMHTTFSPA